MLSFDEIILPLSITLLHKTLSISFEYAEFIKAILNKKNIIEIFLIVIGNLKIIHVLMNFD